jgi:hypothetical protein
LAAGPVAGQLGAPIFTTPRDSLAPAAAAGLADYAPEPVIITGGDAALAPAVAAAIADATGLDDADVLRAAGRDRHETAVAIVALLGEYAPAYLPVAATALGALAADTAQASGRVGGRTADEFVSECDPIWYRNGGVYCSNGATESLNAPVRLPDGAVITGLTANVYDTAVGRTIQGSAT